jgi:hypothetical protein
MTEHFRPDQKRHRIKLDPEDYRLLRIKIYNKQRCCCAKCFRWLRYDEMALHHLKSRGSGGDDSESNVQGLCVLCHIKVHNKEG